MPILVLSTFSSHHYVTRSYGALLDVPLFYDWVATVIHLHRCTIRPPDLSSICHMNGATRPLVQHDSKMLKPALCIPLFLASPKGGFSSLDNARSSRIGCSVDKLYAHFAAQAMSKHERRLAYVYMVQIHKARMSAR